jgi:hypothetical protein
MAAFHLIIYGRFWVITEEPRSPSLLYTVAALVADPLPDGTAGIVEPEWLGLSVLPAT